MEAPEELRGLARNEPRKIAVRGLKARGPRKDGGLLSGWGHAAALREVAAGDPGDHIRDRLDTGQDINDPQESHVLRALPGRTFSALQLICITYAGFKRIEPGMDIGMELGEEWGLGERFCCRNSCILLMDIR